MEINPASFGTVGGIGGFPGQYGAPPPLERRQMGPLDSAAGEGVRDAQGRKDVQSMAEFRQSGLNVRIGKKRPRRPALSSSA